MSQLLASRGALPDRSAPLIVKRISVKSRSCPMFAFEHKGEVYVLTTANFGLKMPGGTKVSVWLIANAVALSFGQINQLLTLGMSPKRLMAALVDMGLRDHIVIGDTCKRSADGKEQITFLLTNVGLRTVLNDLRERRPQVLAVEAFLEDVASRVGTSLDTPFDPDAPCPVFFDRH